MRVIFPISYWGSIYYFQEIAKHNAIALEAFEPFPKQTHRNRFAIVAANGKLVLTAPVRKPNGTKTLSKDIELITDKATLQKNWRAITSAYASSPFFDHYEKELEELFLKPKSNLLEHCIDINAFFLRCWGIDLICDVTEAYDWKNRSENLDIDYLDLPTASAIYHQVRFQKEQEFVPNPSAIDLLCNMGPLGRNIILSVNH